MGTKLKPTPLGLTDGMLRPNSDLCLFEELRNGQWTVLDNRSWTEQELEERRIWVATTPEGQAEQRGWVMGGAPYNERY